MPVIPFNPGGAATTRRDGRCASEAEPPDAATAEPGDLARAARLEHALIAALRENAANWARAERAERMLGERMLGERDQVRPSVRG